MKSLPMGDCSVPDFVPSLVRGFLPYSILDARSDAGSNAPEHRGNGGVQVNPSGKSPSSKRQTGNP